jgi:hypothetical protein
MQDEPTPTELTAVADFLRNDIALHISGHDASICGLRSTRSI